MSILSSKILRRNHLDGRLDLNHLTHSSRKNKRSYNINRGKLLSYRKRELKNIYNVESTNSLLTILTVNNMKVSKMENVSSQMNFQEFLKRTAKNQSLTSTK